MKRIKSGTEEVFQLLQPMLAGKCGLDLGYGGHSIAPHAINVDLPVGYTHIGNDPKHLSGDARKLIWFNDDCLDFVYSSHLLEDFENTKEILVEWYRVIKKEGVLILYLPVEKKYRAYCEQIGEGRNMNHSIENMGIEYLSKICDELGYRYEMKEYGLYSFLTLIYK